MIRDRIEAFGQVVFVAVMLFGVAYGPCWYLGVPREWAILIAAVVSILGTTALFLYAVHFANMVFELVAEVFRRLNVS
jgi:hypothetical protein